MGAQAKIVTDSWYFEGCVAMSVLLLMYVLALQSTAVPPNIEQQFTLRIIEIFVTVFISFEMWLQLIMKLGKKIYSWHAYWDYFKDPWNAVDIFVVVVSWLYLLVPDSKWTSIGRVLRVVRPMRSLRLISSVQLVFQCIVEDKNLFRDVSTFLLVALSVFALIGLTLFRGTLQYECIDSTLPQPIASASWTTWTCPDTLKCQRELSDLHPNLPPPQCVELVQKDGAAREVGDDAYGVLGFDDIGQSFVTMVVRMSYDDGLAAVPLALYMADATSKRAAWLFNLISNVVLSFVGMQLMLALVVGALVNASSMVKKRSNDDRVASKLRMSRMRANKAIGIDNMVSAVTNLAAPIMDGLDISGQRLEMADALKQKDWSAKRCGCLRNAAKVVVTSVAWRPAITIAILLYTLCLINISSALESTATTAEIKEQELKETVLLYGELALVGFFVLEILGKLLGVGTSLYFANQESVIDLIVVLLTVVGCTVNYLKSKYTIEEMDEYFVIRENTYRGLRMLRVAQLLRMLYKEDHIFKIMSDIFKTWKALVGVVLLVVFSTCMTSIIGMHLIGGSLGKGQYEATEFHDGYPRTNFETFGAGIFASFQFTIGDGWSQSLSWYTNSYRENDPHFAWLPQVFLCALFMWANAILFNLFVAVLLINFGLDEHLKMPAQKVAYFKWARHHVDKHMALTEAIHDDCVSGEEVAKKSEGGEPDLVATLVTDLNKSKSHKSCFIFSPSSKPRLLFAKVISSDIFETVWVILCVLSCGSIALRSQEVTDLMAGTDGSDGTNKRTDEGTQYYYGFMTLEVLVVGIFMTEAILKSIACGFVSRCGGIKPYLRDANNMADFIFIVAYFLSYSDTVVEHFELDDATCVLIRNLGPMIGLLQNVAIREVLLGFAAAVPGVLAVSLPISFLLLVFSIVGVEMYGGRMSRCACYADHREAVLVAGDAAVCSPGLDYDALSGLFNTTDVHDVSVHQLQCEELMSLFEDEKVFIWANDPNVGSFDDVFEGVQLLYMALTSGYVSPMQAVCDSTFPGQAPSQDFSGWSGRIFFICVNTVFTLFLMNVFIGVISITFSKQSGKGLVTVGQKRWNRCYANADSFDPALSKELAYQPDEDDLFYDIRMKAFRIVMDRKFGILSTFCVSCQQPLAAAEFLLNPMFV